MTAIDLSPMRWRWRPRTPRRNGLAGRVELLQGDLLAPVAGRRFDLIASNPPYVAAGDAVDPEVAGTSRPSRSIADEDGRAIHERLGRGRPGAAEPGGQLVIEVGEGQAPWLAEHLAELGYGEIAVTRDLRGVERVVSARYGG